MSQPAETLRGLAQSIRFAFGPAYPIKEQEAASCEAGASAWEIVERIVAWSDEDHPSGDWPVIIAAARALLDAEGR